tara:strand:- start:367 stop:564 length:198 start_codon:yes stop_codon:yes gene_type:complete
LDVLHQQVVEPVVIPLTLLLEQVKLVVQVVEVVVMDLQVEVLLQEQQVTHQKLIQIKVLLVEVVQ